ncbi:MAG TPA: MotA/TolQ/ExbB proton channel family protein [Longimicrobiales bacterium]|nr:MotA/TolQ/ExbB proton channel family protein [Longimicrobiales bacterium]
MGISLIELWGTMGWFARGIVFILLFMSIIVATITIRKLIMLRRSRGATLRFSGAFSEALTNEDFAEAERLVEANQRSHLAAVFRRVFPSLTFHSEDHDLSAAEIASVQRMIDLNTLEQLSKFRRGLGVLATVGATAPFVGLLGTTMGVVNAFTGMAVSGSGGLAAISAGIAEALITTAFGLLVAIPGVWLYNYFINRIDYISMEITYATKEFVDFLLRYEARLHQSVGKASESITTLMDSANDPAAMARSRMS